ncbi:serine hydrolase [Allorhodopirellula heiligendammensis]|uniref:D-alanyl-D-alanine carboxypeptidase n=1 Tax=Allorhodopirellula heiligendammensis TaxID=2714739 RepID=A0A5C6BFR9_9BACT|nr:serine hydrolase [Allorhodopirellula heiligendammensis]TWU10129.1 D-alanyl-D-alanine carboxypeptidase precursor [Allorhodopirellula heiligendammensis]
MRRRSAYFCHLLLIGILLSPGLNLRASAQPQSRPLQDQLAELCRKHDVPGMTAAVVNAEGLVQADCFGVRKRGTSDKIELTDRFPIGSNTKSMVATLAAVLVEGGRIDWNTTIGDVWPNASDDHLHPKLRAVTLDQLLSHQSGLAGNISDISNQEWASFFEERRTPVLERRHLLKLVLAKAPSQAQGTFVYSNLGYAIASAMMETRAGKSFESLMKAHVFSPLAMRSADFRTLAAAKQLQPPLLWGHQAETGEPADPRTAGVENPTVYAAAGTVHVSLEDYAKYAQWQLAGKPSPVLRTQDAFDHLHTPQCDYTSPGAKYGAGWIMMDTPLGPALNHTGSNTNAFALIWLFPESDLGVIVCTNSGQPQAFTACDEMVGFLMKKYAPASDSRSDANAITPERLVGRYQLTPSFVFDVRLQDGHLMVGITNQPTQEVFADSPTKWSYRGVDAQLEFHIRAQGSSYALTLHQNGAAQVAKRVRD